MFRRFLYGLAALVFSSALAYALTSPATIGPRDFNTQQVGYFRIYVTSTGTGISANGYSCVGGASNSVCSVKVGALPANAFLIRATQQIVANFAGGGTDQLGLGTSSAGVNIVAAESVHSGAGAISSLSFASGGSGTLLTTGVAQSGLNGGYDLYVSYTYSTTPSAAGTGQVVIVLEYIAPNDGTCVSTPMNTTPTAC